MTRIQRFVRATGTYVGVLSVLLPACASADGASAGSTPAGRGEQEVMASQPATSPESPTPPKVELLLAALERGEIDQDQARTRLEAAMGDYDARGRLEDRMVAHAHLGRWYAAAGRQRDAAAQYEIVLSMWATLTPEAKEMRSEGLSESLRLRSIGRSLTALGEALFFEAEAYRHANVDVLQRPPAGSAATSAAAMQSWIDARRAAIEDADKHYLAIVNIQPAPPPVWVIASASRVADMWDALAQDIRDSTTTASQTEADRVALWALVAQCEARARAAFTTCQTLAQTTQVESEHSRSCDAWLRAHP